MNHALEKLAADLQEIQRKACEPGVPSLADIASFHVIPYVPSQAYKEFDAEEAEYNRRVQDVFFGEIL